MNIFYSILYKYVNVKYLNVNFLRGPGVPGPTTPRLLVIFFTFFFFNPTDRANIRKRIRR